jgi:transposase
LDFVSIYRGNVIDLDVHQSTVVACVLIAGDNNQAPIEFKTFGGFTKDMEELAQWRLGYNPDPIVMESAGAYWNSPYRAPAKHGLDVYTVNARHAKNVPGRKTDMADSQRLAMHGRAGLVKNGFVS